MARPCGTPRLEVYILPGAATAVANGLENVKSHQPLAVDERGYPVTSEIGSAEPTITYEGRVSGGFKVKVTWSEQVEDFAEIGENGAQHDLRAGYDGGPDVFIEIVTEEETGLVYTAVVPVAPPSGNRRMVVDILPGAATEVGSGLGSRYGYLEMDVDADGYPTRVRAPAPQEVNIVPPRGSARRRTDVDVRWTPGDTVEVRARGGHGGHGRLHDGGRYRCGGRGLRGGGRHAHLRDR